VTIDRHILLDSVFHHTIAGDNIWTSRCPISLQSFQKQNQLLIRSGLCLSSYTYKVNQRLLYMQWAPSLQAEFFSWMCFRC